MIMDMNAPELALAMPPVPLAIGVRPFPGESLIGLISRATRENVLGTNKIILEAAGLTLLHPGTIGQDIGDGVGRLAFKLGCTAQEVEALCHPYLDDPEGPYDIRWGSGALLRRDLLVERRRVSPESLKGSEHHRADWMIELLPFCPESLELLIEHCASCGSTLGWRSSWGIGHCDQLTCRKRLTHPTGDRLPAHLAGDYRTFAALISADPAKRGAALESLHPDLQQLPPSVLVTFMIHAGGTVSANRVPTNRGTIQNLPPLELATIVSRGANLLQDWPNHMRAEVAAELDRAFAKGSSDARAFQIAVRRLGLPKNARPAQIKLMHDALPEAFEGLGTALGGLGRPVINGAQACRTIGISTADLRKLRDANLITHRTMADGRRVQAFYDLEVVETFAARLRSSAFASRLEQALGIPRYATEQLACLAHVELEQDPGVCLLYPTLRLRQQSMDTFIEDLEQAARTSEAPSYAIPLGTALKRIGGGPKPWGHVLAAMRAGKLPFWLTKKGKFARAARVTPKDIDRFKRVTFEAAEYAGFPFGSEYTQVDAIDILNIDAEQVQRVMEAGDLVFRPAGVALVTGRVAVNKLATETISAAEAAAHLSVSPSNIPRFMRQYPEVPSCAVGWERSSFFRMFP
jgi:hypothetical protein